MATSSLVGSVFLEMAANVARLQADMNDAKKVVGNAMDEMNTAIGHVKSALGVLAGIGSVAAFVGVIKGAIESAAALQHMSEKTGASVEALSIMSQVAKLSGTSMETVSLGMNKLSKNLETSTIASKGTGQAIAALGLSFNDFVAMSPEQRMNAIAKAMDGFADGSGKTAAAMALLGRGGAELLPYLRDLAVAGDLHAKVTKEQAAQADEFDKNLIRLKASGEGWKRELAMGMLPALDEAAKAMLIVFNETGGLRDEIKKLSADGSIAAWTRNAVVGFTYLMDGVEYLKRAFVAFGEYLAAGTAEWVARIGGFASGAAKFLKGDFTGALADASEGMRMGDAIAKQYGQDLRDQFSAETLGSKIRGRMDDIHAFGNASEAAKPKVNMQAQLDGNAKAAEALAKKYEDLIAASKGHTAAVSAQQESTTKLTDGEKKLLDMQAKIETGTLEYNQALYASAAAQFQAEAAAERAALAYEKEKKWLEEASKENAAHEAQVLKTVDAVAAEVTKQQEANALLDAGVGATARAKEAKLLMLAVQAESKAALMDEIDWTGQLGDAQRKLAGNYKDLAAEVANGEMVKAAKDATEAWNEAANVITDDLSNAFEDSIMHGKDLFQSLKDYALKLFENMVLTPVIKASIGSIIGSVGGAASADSGGGGGGGLGGLASLFGGGGSGGSGIMGSLGGLSSMFGNFSAGMGAGSGAAMSGGIGGVASLGSGLMGSGATAGGLGAFAGGLGALGAGAMVGMGAGKAISGGYSVGGNANIATGIGSAIGMIWGPIGSAIGGAIGGLVNRAFGYKAKETGEFGISGTVSAGDVTAQNYANWTQKGGWLRKDKSGTNISELSTDQAGTLKAASQSIYAQTQVWAQALKLPAEELAKVSYNLKVTLGQDEAKNIDAINAAFEGYQSALVDKFSKALAPFQKAGETLTDTMSRLAGLEQMASAINDFGGIFSKIASSSIDARDNLVQLAGGIDALMAKAGQFVQDYYSQGEKAGMQSKQVLATLSDLGIDASGLTDRASFRALVESQNVSTETGQQQLVALLNLAPAFAQLADYLASQNITLADAAAQAPTTDVLKQLIEPTNATKDAVTTVNSSISVGNKLLQTIADIILNGNTNLANGLTLLGNKIAEGNTIAQTTAANIADLVSGSNLNDAAPNYGNDLGSTGP